MKNKKIGVFDSGLGGLSILKELINILPNENYLFYEDSINNPYGEKSDKELFEITSKVVDYLIEKDCKIIVIACNTATTSCMKKLREKYKNTIFVGTVPAIKMAYDSNSKNTLLLATSYTIKSERVNELLNDYTRNDQKVYVESGKNLANLIEIGNEEDIYNLLNEILLPYKDKIDSIVLGCTHYPLVSDIIKKIIPGVQILDGSFGVAKETKHQLVENDLVSDSKEEGTIIIENSKSEDLVKRSYEILKVSNQKEEKPKKKVYKWRDICYFINSRVGVFSVFAPVLLMIDLALANKKNFMPYVILIYLLIFFINLVLFILTLRIKYTNEKFYKKNEIMVRNALAISLLVSYFSMVMVGIFSLVSFKFNMTIFIIIELLSVAYCCTGIYFVNKKNKQKK